MTSPGIVVKFRVSLRASFGGPVMRHYWSDLPSRPPLNLNTDIPWVVGYDASEARARRLNQAVQLYLLTLDKPRCIVTPKRLTLVGQDTFACRYADGAIPSILAVVGWTLHTVYGHPGTRDSMCDCPMPGLSLTVAEVNRD